VCYHNTQKGSTPPTCWTNIILVKITMNETLFDSDDQSVPAESGENQEKERSSEVEARYRISPLSLTVFKRETENGVFRNFNLQRAYTQDDGETFDHTESLRPRDLRKAARLLQRAADDIQGLSVEAVENGGGGE